MKSMSKLPVAEFKSAGKKLPGPRPQADRPSVKTDLPASKKRIG